MWHGTLLQQHIAWHLTLFCLETNEVQTSLNVYKNNIISEPIDQLEARHLQDAIAFLWRAMLKGHFFEEEFEALKSCILK
jgi:hypothetical protein